MMSKKNMLFSYIHNDISPTKIHIVALEEGQMG